MVRKLRTSDMSHKKRWIFNKFNKMDFLIGVIMLFLVGFMVFFTRFNSPPNLVKSALQNRYHTNVTDVHLERTGNNTYRLADAPIDPLSGIRLENWRVEYFGIGFMVLVQSLDAPADDGIGRIVSICVTDEQYDQLQLLADEQGISLDQTARKMLLQELNR